MKKTISLVKDTFAHWQEKRASRMGAAISYYAIFSIAPLFILVISIVRAIFDRHTTALAITRTLNVTVGSNLGGVIQELINSSYLTKSGTVATIIGGAVLIIVALSVLAELNNDLDELWELPSQVIEEEETVAETAVHFVRERLISLFLILLCGILFLFTVAFSVLGSFFHASLPAFLLDNAFIIQILNNLVTLLIMTVLFGLIYKILPNTKLPRKELFWGAFATAVLFLIGKFLIAWYISAFAGTSEFGAAGSVVGLLLWIYYSAQVFLIGASGTFVYSKQYGFLSKKH